MERLKCEKWLSEIDAEIEYLKADMIEKQIAYEKSKGVACKAILYRSELIISERKHAVGKCYNCAFCYKYVESPYDNRCAKDNDLGTQCEFYYELPF